MNKRLIAFCTAVVLIGFGALVCIPASPQIMFEGDLTSNVK